MSTVIFQYFAAKAIAIAIVIAIVIAIASPEVSFQSATMHYGEVKKRGQK